MNTFILGFIYITVFVIYTNAAKEKLYMCYQTHSVDGYVEPVVWHCHGQLPLWSYNLEKDECVEFRFGGCGGNDNSFYTKEECEEACKS